MLHTFFSLSILAFLIKFSYVSSEPCIVRKFEDVEAALACKQIILDNLNIPGGLTLKLNLTDGAEVIFNGKTTFGYKIWSGPLVTINGTGITVRCNTSSESIIDGQGQLYWDGKGEWSKEKPQMFTIQAFGESVFKDFHILNSPKDVVQVTNSDDVIFDNWIIDNLAGDPGTAPVGKEGHNTDGFDVWNSTNILINNSRVWTQDDCVALRCGANITVANMYCHGTHGLSISVGFSNDFVELNTLTNVSFYSSVLEGGRNGIHIKTHVDGGFGNISHVVYKGIVFNNISNHGILIEENYTDRPPSNHSSSGREPRNNVPIRDLILEHIQGEVQKKAVPIQIVCAEKGCFDWIFSDVSVNGTTKNNCNFEPEGFKC